MAGSATVRVMTPEEIAARAGGETPFFHWPDPATVFAEREMRLRQLAPGHAMGDFLRFMADVAHAQQARLARMPAVPLPDRAALDAAARRGQPPLPASDWPRDPAWHGVLRALVDDLRPRAPAGAQAALERLAQADAEALERQAAALLDGVSPGLDLACAPLVAAALQVLWLHMVHAVCLQHTAQGQPFGRLDDQTVCPCCGSRPTASLTRTAGEAQGQRYLHCSLCSTQWHMVRIKCTHCLSTRAVAYQSLDTDDARAGPDGGSGADMASDTADTNGASARAAQATVQAETCDDCGHYLKILHADRDPFVEPVADDLASLTLDLLVSDTGKSRHGVNLMLLFGEPDAPAAGAAAPPDPGAR